MKVGLWMVVWMFAILPMYVVGVALFIGGFAVGPWWLIPIGPVMVYAASLLAEIVLDWSTD